MRDIDYPNTKVVIRNPLVAEKSFKVVYIVVHIVDLTILGNESSRVIKSPHMKNAYTVSQMMKEFLST